MQGFAFCKVGVASVETVLRVAGCGVPIPVTPFCIIRFALASASLVKRKKREVGVAVVAFILLSSICVTRKREKF